MIRNPATGSQALGYATAIAAVLTMLLAACQPPEESKLRVSAPTLSLSGVSPANTPRDEVGGGSIHKISADAGSLRAQTMDAHPLRAFFQALQSLETGNSREPLVILQLGDSHTANDAMSGRMRQLFQERFGAAGRGWLPPGIPFKYYRPNQITVTQEGAWEVVNSFERKGEGPFGLTGYRSEGATAEDRVVVESSESGGFDRVAIEVLMQPGGGTLDIKADDFFRHSLTTTNDLVQGGWLDIPLPKSARRLELRPSGDGPVSLLSWTVGRRRAGIVYENMGIIGATVNIVARWEPVLLRWELGMRRPSLIVVAYGTNEGFDDSLAAAAYTESFQRHVRALQTAAPQASILILGPPDANRYNKRCPESRREKRVCAPLSDSDYSDYINKFKEKPKPEACRWHPPPNLVTVRNIQRRVAEANGWLFWDWAQVMGGACGIHEWAQRDPPLAMEDHVHLRAAGYHQSAEALFRDIMVRYERFRQEHPGKGELLSAQMPDQKESVAP